MPEVIFARALSGLLWMAALASYARYASAPSVKRYLCVTVLFALGLMAKPSVVTLPFALLLLDYWPLRRWKNGYETNWNPRANARLIAEKIPLVFLSVVVSITTFIAQREVGAMASLRGHSLSERIDNAPVAYLLYLWETIWPADLTVIYTRRHGWPFTGVLAAAAVLLAITWFVLRFRCRAPYLVTGWFWFLGTLVPMIGLVQVGAQFKADRYTYIPLTGVFVVAVWGLTDLTMRYKMPLRLLAFGSAAVLLTLICVTRYQLAFWENSRKLFTRAVAVTHDNWAAHHNFAVALGNEKEYDEADKHFVEALRLVPGNEVMTQQRGEMQILAGNYRLALACFNQVLAANPTHVEANLRLALLFATSPEASLRDGERALKHAKIACEKSRELDSGPFDVQAAAYAENGRFEDALKAAERAYALAKAAGDNTREIQRRIDLYRRREPYRIEIRKDKAAL